MAGKRRDDVREEDVTGLKYFDKLAPLLARLHEVGCGRDKAGNRKLHFDQYCMLVPLFLFNPVVRSLRAIEQASELRNVQRQLGCQRASLGSLSEATDVFQPERLKEIIAELGEQLEPIARDPRLKDAQHALTLVDGTLLKGLPVLVQAAMLDPRAAKHKAKFRLHTQFDRERSVPIRIDVTAGSGRGETNERIVLAKALETRPAGVDHRPDVPLPLDHRDFLPILQACAGMPTLAAPRSSGRRDSDLLCDHRLHAHQSVDGPQTDATNLRDDLPLLRWLGGGGRTTGPFGQAASPRGLSIPVRRSVPLPRQRLLLRVGRLSPPTAFCLPSSSHRSPTGTLQPTCLPLTPKQ